MRLNQLSSVVCDGCRVAGCCFAARSICLLLPSLIAAVSDRWLLVRSYESVMIGFFSIFRGFVNENGTCTGARTSGEHDEIYLGFSR